MKMKILERQWRFADFAMLLYVVSLLAFNSGSGFDHLLNIVSFALCLISLAADMLKNHFVIKIPKYTIYMCAFLMFAVASYTWAEWPSFVFSTEYSNIIVEGIQLILISLFVSVKIKNKEEVKKSIQIIWIAIIIMLLKIVIFTPISDYLSGKRIGTVTGLWVTDVGAVQAIGIGISIYLFSCSKKRINKILISLAALLLLIYMFLTGSRQAILMVTIYILSYFFMGTKGRKRLTVTLGVLLVGILCCFAIMEIPFLYGAIGERLLNMIAGFGNGMDVDSSIETRSVLMGFARQMFLERPILGWGFANVAGYTKNIGYFITTFSHCNYLEILANLGLIGFGLFYYYQYKTLFQLYKKAKSGNKFVILCFSLLFTLLVADYVSVTVLVIYHHIIIQILCLENELSKSISIEEEV